LLGERVREDGRLYFRLAFGVLRDAHAAEEVCQQAMLKAWDQRDRIEQAKLRAWLARVVVNESLYVARRRKVEQKSVAAQADRGAKPALAPDDALATREAVVRAMDRLPEMARTVVALRVMQGISGNEVKDLLGCSAAEVSRQLHAGMEQLRGLLAEFEVRSASRAG
jgi:RNA polymerase sigma-70 factor (ECF subfamily)